MGPIISISKSMPLSITARKSCYNISDGLSINEDEKLLTFYNRVIDSRTVAKHELSVRYELDGINVKNNDTGDDLTIRICRTLRVPEDGTVHDMSTTFSPFPMIDTSRCELTMLHSLDPCYHAFCTTCIRNRKRTAGGTICILCSKPASKVTVISGPMEAPTSESAVSQEQSTSSALITRKILRSATDSDDVPQEIRRQLPSLTQMGRHVSLSAFWPDGNLNQVFVERLLSSEDFEDDIQDLRIDLRIRLGVAQILKDVDYPRMPLPPYVRGALNTIMVRFLRSIKDDTADLLLSVGVDLNTKDKNNTTLISKAVKENRGYIARRLIDEGCDWEVFERCQEHRWFEDSDISRGVRGCEGKR
jgi:hypothetical protein